VKLVTEGAQAGSQQSTEVAAAAEELGRQMDILRQRIDKYKLSAPPTAKLPQGLTPELIQQVLRLVGAQPGAAAFAGGAFAPLPSATPSESTVSARAVLPLDQDERGYKGF
jgi:anti-sigma factor RsiW